MLRSCHFGQFFSYKIILACKKHKKTQKKYINIEASHNEYYTYYLENDYEKE